MFRYRQILFLLAALLVPIIPLVANDAEGVLEVRATKDEILIKVRSSSASMRIVELQPLDSTRDAAAQKASVAQVKKTKGKTISISRFDGARDRLYSAFVAISDGKPVGNKRFVEEWKGVSKFSEAYPKSTGKKGLQVQMVDDALALGVKHAALNLNFGNIISLRPATNDLPWNMDGRIFYFRRGALEHMDHRIKTLSDAGLTVTLILLYYKDADPELNKIMLHPKYDQAAPQNLTAFNTATEEGLAWYKACIEFIAHRYSQPDEQFGRVVNFIVGNEVNSHWHWANMGRVTMEDFARDYLRSVRITHTAVRKFSATARVFISLEHHWGMRYPGGDDLQTFASKPFLHYFTKLSRTYGDFDWHVAFHPYPENLFEPRTWSDKSATMEFETPRITFKNIELLPKYLKKGELLYRGKPRRIILSEQGFHSSESAEGELWQAAAYCYAYYKIDRIEGIDSFILHRHVDHAIEGGLNLGLWRRNKEGSSAADPVSKKPIYDVFRDADTAQWEKTFQFALPVIGIKSWKEIDPAATKYPASN